MFATINLADLVKLSSIGKGCFYRCWKIGALSLLPSVSWIGPQAFHETDLLMIDLRLTQIKVGSACENFEGM
jgi:hypothetical protein